MKFRNNMNKFNFAFLFSFLLLSSCMSTDFFGSSLYSVKEVKYQTTDQHELAADLYLPNNTMSPKPLVVVIHGGGWTNRTGDMESLCRKLAKSGFAALNITYRLAPDARYPVQLYDVKAAFSWIKSNLQTYQLDPQQIYIWGYSAGAHLAFLLGNEKDLGLPVAGLAVGGIPSNLPSYPKSPMITDLMGARYSENPKAWEQASPLSVVSSQTPPTYIYHGEDDSLVGLDQSQLLAEKLKAAQVEHEFHIAKNMGHIFVYLFSSESEDKGIAFFKRKNPLLSCQPQANCNQN